MIEAKIVAELVECSVEYLVSDAGDDAVTVDVGNSAVDIVRAWCVQNIYEIKIDRVLVWAFTVSGCTRQQPEPIDR